MKVVLLKDVAGLGKRFETKNVSDGHALNFLFPRGLAQVATASVIKKIEEEQAADVARRQKEVGVIVGAIEGLKGGVLEIAENVNEKGHLFSAVHKAELILKLKEKTGVAIPEGAIELNKPIKEAGEHTITVRAGEKSLKLKVNIVPSVK